MKYPKSTNILHIDPPTSNERNPLLARDRLHKAMVRCEGHKMRAAQLVELQELVEGFKSDIDSGRYNYLESGGFLVRRSDSGAIEVYIDPKLFDELPPSHA